MKNDVNTGCISEQQLLSYINNNLSPSEKRQVELHLTDCELCSDALEGLRLLQGDDRATEIVAELKHHINKKLEGRTRPLILQNQWMQVAAVFFILAIAISGYIYIKQFGHTQVALGKAEKTEYKSEQPAPQVTSGSDISKKPSPDAPEKATQLPTDNKRKEPASVSATKEISANEPTARQETREENVRDESSPLPAAAEEEKDISGVVSTDDQKEKYFKKESAEDVMATPATPQIAQQEVKIHASKMAGRPLTTSEISNIYTLGKSYLEKKEYNAAMQQFNIIINNGKSKYYDDALWNNSEIAIMQNRIDDARKILQELKSGNGSYQKRATDKLNELQ
jgi:TolA-binding protein